LPRSKRLLKGQGSSCFHRRVETRVRLESRTAIPVEHEERLPELAVNRTPGSTVMESPHRCPICGVKGDTVTEATMSAIHHVAINVHDLESSERWYTRVLGFRRLGPFAGDGFGRMLVRHPSGVVLGLTRHDDPEADVPFSERRTGLDHVAFGVADRETLEAWIAWFDELGVAHSEIKQTPLTGSFLVAFRDPDGIQLELYAPGQTAPR